MAHSSICVKSIRNVEQVSADLGFPIDPRIPVGQLSAGMQQRVAILKVLASSPDLVMFDEPTSVLTPQEVEIYSG